MGGSNTIVEQRLYQRWRRAAISRLPERFCNVWYGRNAREGAPASVSSIPISNEHDQKLGAAITVWSKGSSLPGSPRAVLTSPLRVDEIISRARGRGGCR